MTDHMSWGVDARQSSAALLTPDEMAEADRQTIASGTPGIVLMRRAGAAVARQAALMLQQTGRAGRKVILLCGPGNNGGDGLAAARVLSGWGVTVQLHLLARLDALKGDAALAAREWIACGGEIAPFGDLTQLIGDLRNPECGLVIDALFGAGLSRALSGLAAELVSAVAASSCPVLAVDVPSGLDGATGTATGPVMRADRTVTFARRKPGHVLLPGRELCGETVVCDIGICSETIAGLRPKARLNVPAAWPCALPQPGVMAHKYSRGSVLAVSGPFSMTGAIRLSAEAALRAGAGLVTVACDPSATAALVPHLTAVMLRPLRGEDDLAAMLEDQRLTAAVIGPGAGRGGADADKLKARVLQLALAGASARLGLVLDADALSVFEGAPDTLFQSLRQRQPPAVLTPHAGEFRRLFAGLGGLDRLSAARAAAELSGAIIVSKGSDTVIAAPDGRAYINDNAPPCLATAGSGDVLAGTIAGLLAQGVAGFEAAAMGVHLHGAAGALCGPGMTAEDLLPALASALARLQAE